MTSQAQRSTPTIALHRAAAVSGVWGALVLVINAAKRSAIIPTTPLTQLAAPFAEILALGLVTALFAVAGHRAGTFGTIAFMLNFVALASLIGVEVVINLVFAKVSPDAIAGLRAGPLGIYLTTSSILFLCGTIAFVVSLFLAREVPRVPLGLYLVGAVPVALRASVPAWALNSGLVVLAAGIGWLAIWLWRNAPNFRTCDLPSDETA